MALSEQTFGPSLGVSSVYLDTTKSQWLDAVIVRYQERGGDADFSGELSLVASFEEVTDFSDSNII